MLHPAVFIANSPGKGKGVFTSEPVSSGTLLEVAPVIVMTGAERQLLDKTRLHDYIFEWGPGSEECCMALGLVPIYNHAYNSNCEYEMDFEEHSIAIKAVRDIAEGEELFINYNGEFDNQKPLWFPAQ